MNFLLTHPTFVLSPTDFQVCELAARRDREEEDEEEHGAQIKRFSLSSNYNKINCAVSGFTIIRN